VNVNEVIRNAIGIVKYDRRAKQVKFKLNLAEEAPNLYLVPDQLLQVVLNILINALDALKDGHGIIEIKTTLNEQYLKISIKDDGQGIAPEHLNKIFEPFFTTKKVGQGTGLGLSVSYGIIKNFKGKIEVKSKLGQGSEFIIYLPLNAQGDQK
jgi:signal transduction histidine kinase